MSSMFLAGSWGMVGFADLVLAGLGFASVAYLSLALWRAAGFVQRRSAGASFLPPLTVLKPVCGAEPELSRCLRSFCVQSYPEYQVIFGVRDAGDPAIKVIKRLIAEFPERDLMLLVDGRIHGSNLKVSNLVNMYRAAKHDAIVVSDSDVIVDRDCLTKLVAPLEDGSVGAVTSLYKAAPLPGLASGLGALYINDWFLASAIVDAGMRDVAYCFGPLTAIRRAALYAAGGFDRLAFHLADDFLLGRRIVTSGYRVLLSDCIVDVVVAETLRSLFSHELRWARTVKTLKPLEHALSLVTHPLLPLLLLVAASPTLWAANLIALTLVLRVALHVVMARRFSPETALRPWLVPIRECLCFAVWAASFLGNGIRWREQRFAIGRDGTLVPLAALGTAAVPLRKRAAEVA
jgi:ceramide glucosyltransferase